MANVQNPVFLSNLVCVSNISENHIEMDTRGNRASSTVTAYIISLSHTHTHTLLPRQGSAAPVTLAITLELSAAALRVRVDRQTGSAIWYTSGSSGLLLSSPTLIRAPLIISVIGPQKRALPDPIGVILTTNKPGGGEREIRA
ncbi:hypothetical protein J6590_054336 [Homalodisca vitripennis]|nr:hypothetical protein J6590_054336 [Homalodisca vitripennis]